MRLDKKLLEEKECLVLSTNNPEEEYWVCVIKRPKKPVRFKEPFRKLITTILLESYLYEEKELIKKSS